MTHSPEDIGFMQLALRQAQTAADAGEVPVGAVVVRAGQVIASAHNAPLGSLDPTAHAEVNAMRAVAQVLGNYRLDDCTLYVTLEPCAMCSGAALHARFKRVVFGATEPKTGAAGSVLNLFANEHINHQTHVTGGVLADECAQVLQGFFEQRRAQQQLSKVPLREDALRTPDRAFAGLDVPLSLSHFTAELRALEGLRLHWFDNRQDSLQAPHVYLHGLDGWSAQYIAQLQSSEAVIALDLPGFGLSDKPKKVAMHRIGWHAQVLSEFLASVQPAPVALHAPRLMAPILSKLTLPIHWIDTPEIPADLRDAPYPDRGHMAGPRALSTLLAAPAPTPPPERS
ncbi:MAG: tRNA adenosine(34) deaminase TadA [Burkholderiales bacterium 35-55-47]|jgi:tRNA(adenine34) deaminase|uniref:tRNA adenosine(34) deaminase TadA n=1 Tax=Limnohabitans sp. TaxID=1907725 RepID=UPI000BC439F3|nr:tRNA adenosine(34) deaminase TadA [Limnohabitans sp.]OYY19585.1 MAG: tRNA adenosine(34) deaminase TadA [Burkholderiales bacterium 35-55-47]OYZ74804.1 MAG: tRNA adenosine(34) deaminase TadA [Burkholderiales bacterium 24-55-52]OZB01308.1 MAG: tRNA adenosine(34) deaminase TadA [Burkholderiales bacterium 39-55-53]HQR85764.1 tRNA adenosine(34) deaminase TadA [Limnohabitans sp.]HQS26320.1 tRNA adenosine(34) deaminase TadA [Limnohabitans sp.]